MLCQEVRKGLLSSPHHSKFLLFFVCSCGNWDGCTILVEVSPPSAHVLHQRH